MFIKHALIALAAILCLSLAAPARCNAQLADTIHVGWQAYAFDTSLTFRQIVTTCDSIFALAGLTDTTDVDADTTESDNSDYSNYRDWRSSGASLRCGLVWLPTRV